MPIPPPHDNGLLDHIDSLLKVVTPILGALIAIIVWAWHKMECNVEKIEEKLTEHTENDETVHDKLFTQQRETDAKLNELVGEHKVRIKNKIP